MYSCKLYLKYVFIILPLKRFANVFLVQGCTVQSGILYNLVKRVNGISKFIVFKVYFYLVGLGARKCS